MDSEYVYLKMIPLHVRVTREANLMVVFGRDFWQSSLNGAVSTGTDVPQALCISLSCLELGWDSWHSCSRIGTMEQL